MGERGGVNENVMDGTLVDLLEGNPCLPYEAGSTEVTEGRKEGVMGKEGGDGD